MQEAIESLLEAAKRQGVPPRAAYSVRQAARITGLGRDYLYAQVHAGKLRAVRVGRNYYVPLSELARLLNGPADEEKTPGVGAQGR